FGSGLKSPSLSVENLLPVSACFLIRGGSMTRIFSWAFGFSAAFLLALGAAQATTFSITESTGGGCADGTPSNCTLQEALAVAQANGKSDTILIAPGSYSAQNSVYVAIASENFSLTITGTGGADQTILNGDGGVLMQIATLASGAAADTTVTGLTFTGGVQAADPGGGLLAGTGPGSITVQDCVFQNNSASAGGGLGGFFRSGGQRG